MERYKGKSQVNKGFVERVSEEVDRPAGTGTGAGEGSS